MTQGTLLPNLSEVKLICLRPKGGAIQIELQACRACSCCPVCGTLSHRVHSRPVRLLTSATTTRRELAGDHLRKHGPTERMCVKERDYSNSHALVVTATSPGNQRALRPHKSHAIGYDGQHRELMDQHPTSHVHIP